MNSFVHPASFHVQSEHRGRIDAMLAGAQAARAPEQPLRFVPGAAQQAGLIYRCDETSLALTAADAAPC